ncbi:MAG: hypothetical protein K1X64_01805 [Myxococcaceae bacterium]|nr:hypothetical protein [Myxococcaceae bacterium]
MAMTRPLLATFAMLAFACGPGPKPPPDAGVDTSCGLDCAAQQQYGLILGRCFEYSDTMSAQPSPALGVLVRKMMTLEGMVPTIQVDYLQGGQTRMTDSFVIANGVLRHARRETFPVIESVTYKDDAGNITGVSWLDATAADGQVFNTNGQADVKATSGKVTEATAYKTSLFAAGASELTVPLKKYDQGLQMLFAETPKDHGLDGRRVFVPEVGFILFSSSFSLTPGGPVLQYRLQKIRDLAADGGAGDCGQGGP